MDQTSLKFKKQKIFFFNQTSVFENVICKILVMLFHLSVHQMPIHLYGEKKKNTTYS